MKRPRAALTQAPEAWKNSGPAPRLNSTSD